jgi:hypothetical protein
MTAKTNAEDAEVSRGTLRLGYTCAGYVEDASKDDSDE